MDKSTSASARRRVVFVINSMEGGGAERVLSILLDRLETAFAATDVFLVLLDRRLERYAIPSYVNRIVLDCHGSMLKSIVSLYGVLRRLQPDVVLSFLNRANCANILAARLLHYRCIISERVNTSSHFGDGFKGRINKAIVRSLYPLADRVLVVSKGVGRDLQTRFGVAQQRIEVIYNPYDIERLAMLAAQKPALEIDGDYIVSVGRLVPNKNFALLIRAYHQARLPHKLVILGEGPQHAALQSLIEELALEQKVILGGFVENPYAIMSRARYAVFASRAEGFPNALAEALALSLPVIASDCESGPAEILHNVIHVGSDAAFKADYGVLVPVDDQGSLVQALHWMSDESVYEHYRTKSMERIHELSVDRTVSQYFVALNSEAVKR